MEENYDTTSAFLKVKCNDCENEQPVFSKAASEVKCNICGATLAMPGSGKASIKGQVIGVLDQDG